MYLNLLFNLLEPTNENMSLSKDIHPPKKFSKIFK